MFKFFRKSKKDKTTTTTTTTNSSSNTANANNNNQVRRWSQTVKLQSNPNTTTPLRSSKTTTEELKEQQILDEKLDSLRSSKGQTNHNRRSSLSLGRNNQRKSMLPPPSQILEGSVEDTPIASSNNTSLIGKKSVNKLRRKEVGQSIQFESTSSSSNGVAIPRVPTGAGGVGGVIGSPSTNSRLSHYWHDYSNDPIVTSTVDPISNSSKSDEGGLSTRKPSPPPLTLSPLSPPLNNNSNQSNQLASRLEELAIANADGLLNEIEYRMLRNQVFLKFATSGSGSGGQGETMGGLSGLGEGNEEVPRLDASLFIPRAFGSLSNSPNPQLPPSPTLLQAPPPPLSNLVKSPSLTSRSRTSLTSSTSSLFKRSNPKEQTLSEDWSIINPKGLAITDVLQHQQAELQNPAYPELDYTTFQPRSLRSTYPGFPIPSSSLIKGDFRLIPGSSGSTSNGGGSGGTQSNRSSLLPPSTNGGGTTRSSLNPYTFSSPNSLLAPTASSLDPFIFQNKEIEPNSNELKFEILQLELERNRLGETWEGLERNLILEWELQLGPEGLDYFVNSARAPSEEKSNADQDDTNLNLLEEDLKRTNQLDSSDTRLKNLDLTTSTLPSVSTRQQIHSMTKPELIPSRLVEEVEKASEVLLIKVEEIRLGKRRTEDKYEERLEYLRARLTGVLLKEKLAGK